MFNTNHQRQRGLSIALYREVQAPAACMVCSSDHSICLRCMHQRCTQELINYQFLPAAPVAGPARAVCCHAFDVISPLLQEVGQYLRTHLRIEKVDSNSYFCTLTRQRPCAARVAQQSLELMPHCRLNSVVSVVSASTHAVQQSYPLPVSIHLRVQEKRDLYGHVA